MAMGAFVVNMKHVHGSVLCEENENSTTEILTSNRVLMTVKGIMTTPLRHRPLAPNKTDSRAEGLSPILKKIFIPWMDAK